MSEQPYDPHWVQVCEHTQAWAEDFRREKKFLQGIFDDPTCDIQHVGSTAIPGLAAKPIIDIAVGVPDMEGLDSQYIQKLEEAGYVFRGDAGVPGRLFFRKGNPRSKFHLSVTAMNSDYWNKQILFRDYLRSHEEDVREYMNLKIKLAEQYPNDRATYTALKDPFISSILRKADLWRKQS